MKIFVTYSNTPACIEFGNKMHKEFLKQPDVFIPILGGKALYTGNNKFLKSMQGDDIGENISVLNPYINEHTVIFWVGKHLNEIEDEYIGFCHYRRLFNIPEEQNEIIPSTNISQLDENTIYINKMTFGISNALYFLLNHDPNTVRTFSEFIQKFIRTFPNNVNDFVSFLNSNTLFSGNMFIMHKNQFKKYIEIIIPIYNILFSMIYQFPNVNDRSFGFILERMTTYVILQMMQENKNIQIKQGNYKKLGDIIT